MHACVKTRLRAAASAGCCGRTCMQQASRDSATLVCRLLEAPTVLLSAAEWSGCSLRRGASNAAVLLHGLVPLGCELYCGGCCSHSHSCVKSCELKHNLSSRLLVPEPESVVPCDLARRCDLARHSDAGLPSLVMCGSLPHTSPASHVQQSVLVSVLKPDTAHFTQTQS
jgi:hypothetical protein